MPEVIVHERATIPVPALGVSGAPPGDTAGAGQAHQRPATAVPATEPHFDQASGLRRLFGAAAPRVLPVLIEPGGAAASATAIVGLAQACAREGERTLVLDCARAQIAARLGLRARFDLLHALQGDCRFDKVRLDAGADLCVVPAARAAAAALAARVTAGVLLAPLLAAEHVTDLVVLVVEPAQARLLAAGPGGSEVLVLMPRPEFDWRTALRRLAAVRDGADIAAFRLLFPAWDGEEAARLCSELAQACTQRLGVALRFGGAVRSARDWQHVARAASGWQLARLATPHLARTS